MPRNLRYLGPADSFDTATMFDKVYQFVSPGVKPIDAFGRTWTPTERGLAVAVNNEHATELLSYPWHRFAEVEWAPGTLPPEEHAAVQAAAAVQGSPNLLPADVAANVDATEQG